MEMLLYIGKVSLFWILFYACYQLFLSKQTFFVWNRAYLLGSLLASFLLPLVVYPESAPEMPVMYTVSAATYSVSSYQPEEVSVFTWLNAFILFYLLAVGRRALVFFNNIRQLYQYVKVGEIIELEDCKVVLIDSNEVGSFSFLKWIVVNRNDYELHFDAILRHEMVHTAQRHSYDILFVEILSMIFWFNPVLKGYKHSLQEVHEYLADEAAPNRELYAKFLLAYSLNAPIAALTNHFFKPSQLKGRIQMIYKSRSSKWLRSSYLLAFTFIGAVALLIAGCERIKKNFSETSSGLPGQEMDSTKTIKVEGWVVNQKDKLAIPGASILVEGLQRGTSTDADGHFEIEAPAYGSLIASFDGFHTQTIELKGMANQGIALVPLSEDISDPSQSATNADVKVQTLENPVGGKVFMAVEQQPTFPGGVKAMFQFLGDNIKYPKAASDANVSGRVFISFIVDASGTISDVTVLKGIGFGCDEEAVRVVSKFPKWTPGMQDGKTVSVKYNLPIMFQLEEDKKSAKATHVISDQSITHRDKGKDTNAIYFQKDASKTKVRIRGRKNFNPDVQPLVVVDGVILEEKNALDKLDPNKIQSISVLKDQSATAIYGKKGANGVILVTSKEVR
jgi:TonB family protein